MDTATPRTGAALAITAYLAGGGLFNPENANHNAVRDLLIDCREELIASAERCARLEAALERISHAKPDGLDHSRDVAIIERAAQIARQALGGAK